MNDYGQSPVLRIKTDNDQFKDNGNLGASIV